MAIGLESIGAACVTVVLLVGADAAWSQAQRPPDMQRCAALQTRLEELQAEYRRDEARLRSDTPELAEIKRATLEHDRNSIQQIETQRSAERCPGSLPLAEAPRAIGWDSVGTSPSPPPAPLPGGTGGTATSGPAMRYFVGDYDTRTELGLLHLELDPDSTAWGRHITNNAAGPAIPCANGFYSYRGYLRPDSAAPAINVWSESMCQFKGASGGLAPGVCVWACADGERKLYGKFKDGRAGPAAQARVGVFTLIANRPGEAYLTGDWVIAPQYWTLLKEHATELRPEIPLPGPRPWMVERKN